MRTKAKGHAAFPMHKDLRGDRDRMTAASSQIRGGQNVILTGQTGCGEI